MAVISTASGVAFLKGLYATFSMTTPSTVHTIIPQIIATTGDVPAELMAVNITKPPIIITSPWAKLSIFAIP